MKNAVNIPFTEDDLELLAKDVENIFNNIIEAKRRALQKYYKWTDEEAKEKNIQWDMDVSNCDEYIYKCVVNEEERKMNMLADFMGIDRETLIKLYKEVVDTEYIDYDEFSSYIGKTDLCLQGYVSSFVNKLIDDGFVEDVCDDYGEPGYKKENEDNLIITADWNYMPQGVLSIIEENGYDIEWPDEWICDYKENKMYRTRPDGYGWEPSFFISKDGEVYGIEGNEELYLSMLINNPRRLVLSSIDLEKCGFVDIEQKCRETGWYGRYEDPKDVFEEFKDKYDEMVVQTCYIGPFAVNWKVWGRNKKEKK